MIHDTRAVYFLRSEFEHYVSNILEHKPSSFVVMDLSYRSFNDIKVLGGLQNLELDSGVAIIVYDESTFDLAYREAHPEFFLDPQAPAELKKLFYHPTILDSEGVQQRRYITSDVFLENYEWLKDKYIERMAMEPIEWFKINMINDQMKSKDKGSR